MFNRRPLPNTISKGKDSIPVTSTYLRPNIRAPCISAKIYQVQSNLALRTFSVRAILVLKVKIVLILTVIYYINHQLVIGDLVLKVKQVLILMVLKAKFNCTLFVYISRFAMRTFFVLEVKQNLQGNPIL